jgi:drug/metabolite transporter (DMT)-like permease
MLFDYHPMTMQQILILLGAGSAAMGGQLTITAAYTFAPAKEISVYDYTNVIFTSVWGMLAFGEFPDMLSICGYIIIISMAVLKWYMAIKAERDVNADS